MRLDELRSVTARVETIYVTLAPEEFDARARTLFDLLLDGARKAEETRSRDRVVRIGKILAGAVVEAGHSEHKGKLLAHCVAILRWRWDFAAEG